MKQDLLSKLEPVDQQHLLQFWDELTEPQRAALAEQIQGIDFDTIAQLKVVAESEHHGRQLADRASPPAAIRLNEPDPRFTERQVLECGEQLLRDGRLGMILVAGGQGSRLGFEHPKGMYPLGPVSGRTLFQMLIEKLRAVARRFGQPIPLYLMTSPATHGETVSFLEQHERFGLAADQLHVFCQGTMPAVDASTGMLLLAEPDRLFLAPDGHGGMLQAMHRSGALADARQRGLQHLFYGQVDNPLLQIADPHLLGCHLLAASEMTSQAVAKVDPLERVGNLLQLDGRLQVIEYSDLPDEVARQTNPDGSLRFWAGSIAVHVFDVEFLTNKAVQADALPWHRAHKVVPYVDGGGRYEPTTPNAYKFERFIFDLMPAARNALVVEVDRARAFAPVKNANSAATDTPATAQQLLTRLHAHWLRQAGASVDDGLAVEINPLWALDAEEVAARVPAGLHVTESRYFA